MEAENRDLQERDSPAGEEQQQLRQDSSPEQFADRQELQDQDMGDMDGEEDDEAVEMQ